MQTERTITIIGYGSQGEAWAANLRDSGWYVDIKLPDHSHSFAKAWQHGFIPTSLHEKQWHSPIYALLLPDHLHAPFLQRYQAALPANATLVFAHGYSMAFNPPKLRPDLRAVLLAPKIIGPKLRQHYLQAKSIMCILAVHQDPQLHDWDNALSQTHELAAALAGKGCQALHSSFKEEAVADLFSEQALLCGGLPGLVAETYQLLVAHGINPSIAWQECVIETQLIAEMMVQYGIEGMYDKVSPLARIGGKQARRQLMDAHFKNKLSQLFQQIESGDFARRIKAKRAMNASAQL